MNTYCSKCLIYLISLSHDRVIGCPCVADEELRFREVFQSPCVGSSLCPSADTSQIPSSPVALLCVHQYACLLHAVQMPTGLSGPPTLHRAPHPPAPSPHGAGAACHTQAALAPSEQCRPASFQLSVKFLRKSRDPFPPLPPYTVPSQQRKSVHNSLGSRNQIRSCPGHLVPAPA